MTQAIDKKRLIYLHLRSLNIGWARNMLEKLNEYGLESDLAIVKQFTPNEWKEKVRVAILKKMVKNW